MLLLLARSGTEGDDARMTYLQALQEFFYEDPKSSRYGGGENLAESNQLLHGNFLGSKEEFVEIFFKAGLLDTEILDKEINSEFSQNCEKISNSEGMPEFGLNVAEFNSYGESLWYKICRSFSVHPNNAVVMNGDIIR